ncbi:MAG: FTR1 family iron permease [Deltaproteobacteria bacterium]|nr:FTR1 family iron permease [Deltaproteobacteria bacterium]
MSRATSADRHVRAVGGARLWRFGVAVALALLTLGRVAVADETDFAALIRDAGARYPEESARLAVGDAFLRFESSPLDTEVKAADPTRYRDLEVRWLALAGAMKSGAPAGDVRVQAAALADLLDLVARPGLAASPSSLFVDALLIIVREGFEALLILTALAAYLTKIGRDEKRVLLYAGGGAAVLASLTLAAVAGRIVPLGGAAREVLEGVTMLLAVVVLFTASYWLISKSEAQRWQAFVRSRLDGALGSGHARSLVLLAFLVVFREGFETVLFYEALAGRAAGAPLGLSAVASGFALGVVCLVAIGVALFRYGVRIPIRPFFAVTGALLYVLAFKFAGAGVRELQEAGLVSVTPVAIPDPIVLRDWLAVYPFLEPLLAQAALLVALVVGAVYTLLARSGVRLERAQAARP